MSRPAHNALTPRPNDCSLEELVRQAQRKDHDAFESLFHRYAERIARYLIRLVGNEAEGHNLTQDTFLKVWQTLPTLHDEHTFERWLYRIATNIARDHLRRRTIVIWLSWERQDEGNAHRSIAGPEEQVEQEELILLAWKQVPTKYRPYLYLQMVEGRTQHDIAQLFHISERTVRRCVQHGSEIFRQAYLHMKHI